MGAPDSPGSSFDVCFFFLVQGDGLVVAVLNFMNSLRRIYHPVTSETFDSHNHTVGYTGKSFYSQFRDEDAET